MNTTNDSTAHTHHTTHSHHDAPPAAALPEMLANEAFDRCRAAREALDPNDLLTPNLDIPAMVTTVLGLVPRIEALRPEIHAAAPGFDLANVDNLSDYAYAMIHAQGTYMGSTQSPKELVEMQGRAVVYRDTLYNDASGLVLRGMLAAERLKEFRTKVGYVATATDIVGLVSLLNSGGARFLEHIGSKRQEIDDAGRLGARILSIVGVRGASPAAAAVATATADRQRSFTLVMKAYDQVRRVVNFLRWNHGDADKIAPSLYAGRNTGGNRRKSDPGTDGPGDTSPAPTPASDTTPPAAPPIASAAPAVVMGPGLSAATEPGMPGSDPFGR